MSLDEQLEFPQLRQILFESYVTHERKAVSRFYITLLNRGMEPMPKEEFVMQYVECGLAKQFNEQFGHYYGQVPYNRRTTE